ncbi:hypothetical protein CR155_13510 [Pollutimonas nitritireducens]|uniref:Acyl-CoA dehydrogenase n=1 Tax=Pollutimonas nitritireducens TaxID=2045209 RepID=A0A2N4UE44_9BURK|nr:acyl-CoA dehydrogenase family protein [Pollutimonas nitritireducens]PLC53294.1 hypothetical protein CR155_13510 [Pollutimonas nitritireducens]
MELIDEDTLRMLQDSASDFTSGCASQVRKSRELEFRYDKAVWKRIADQGWISAVIPADKGGLGMGNASVNVIAAHIGAAALPEPYVMAGILPATLLSACETDIDLGSKLSAIASGQLVCALAWQNVAGSLDPNETPLTATFDAEGTVLNGSAHYVMACGLDAVIAVASGPDGLGIYWVPTTSDNLAVELSTRADRGYDATISFKAVRVPRQNRLACGHSVERAVNGAINAGLAAVSSELNGASAKMVEMTLDYLRTRQQFGKPIGSFQALKHRAVDLWMHTEISKEATRKAANELDNTRLSPSHHSAVASGAKARASDTALLVGKQAIQMHGAIGITDEYDLSLYFNRAIVLSAYLGNSALHRARYATYRKG